MDRITKVLQTAVDCDSAKPSVTPVYLTSGFEAGSLFFYTRKNNPNAAELEEALCALEGTRHAIVTTTGMSALTLALDLLRPGDRLLTSQDIYGCSYRQCRRVCEQRGASLYTLDLSDQDSLSQITPDTRMVLFETPTNPFLKTIRISDVSSQTKELNPEALIVVDNTWATPLFQQPLKHGADISLGSATKYICGHADTMGGFVLTNRQDLHDAMSEARFYSGAILDAHSAWLLRRSMQTLDIRLRAQVETTDRIRSFLEHRPEVVDVCYPDVDGQQLTGYGGILFFRLRPDLVEQYTAFCDALELFGTGTSMACVRSMVAQPYTGSHASMTPEEKKQMGLGPDLVRLCFGLESAADLECDLESAFNLLSSGDTRTEKG